VLPARYRERRRLLVPVLRRSDFSQLRRFALFGEPIFPHFFMV